MRSLAPDGIQLLAQEDAERPLPASVLIDTLGRSGRASVLPTGSRERRTDCRSGATGAVPAPNARPREGAHPATTAASRRPSQVDRQRSERCMNSPCSVIASRCSNPASVLTRPRPNVVPRAAGPTVTAQSVARLRGPGNPAASWLPKRLAPRVALSEQCSGRVVTTRSLAALRTALVRSPLAAWPTHAH